MQLRNTSRKQAKIKMCLQGSSGSGKTLSALLLAYGITNDWQKIAVIDAENKSADLYAHLGNYKVLPFEPPYSPERYVQAIEVCLQQNIEVIIIDSISHCWEYLLDYHSSMAGNSFTNWAKINPMQKLFTDKLLQSDVHVIATMRSKQDYVLQQKDGKYIPEKVGLKGIFRDGLEYEFTLVFDIDSKHNAVASKDRTSLFVDKPEFKITADTGKKIIEWCNSGIDGKHDVMNQITSCKTMQELIDIYNNNPQYHEILKNDFTNKKLIIEQQQKFIPNIQNSSTNGQHLNNGNATIKQ